MSMLNFIRNIHLIMTEEWSKRRAEILPLNCSFRKMYWASRGLSPKIEQANMDGSSRTTLISSGLIWANSLALDHQSRLLYWCDAFFDKIERVDLQGNNRVVILDLSLDNMHPFGLALSSGVLYWSDWNSQSVHKYNMTASSGEIVARGMGTPMELHIFDHSKVFSGKHFFSFIYKDVFENKKMLKVPL